MHAKIFATLIFFITNFCCMLTTFAADALQPERQPHVPVINSYWAGWSKQKIPNFKFDVLLLAFALLKRDNKGHFYTDYTASGNFQHHTRISSFAIWNKWIRANRKAGARIYVSYGGMTNKNLRGMIIHANDQQLASMTNEIKANIKKYHFDGVDLDIENWWSYAKTDNEKFAVNLAKMVKLLRQSLDNDPDTRGKPITLAVGWNAAGDINMMPVPGDTYAGTMKIFFADNEAMNATAAINIMSYGTLIPNFYSRIDLIDNILNQFSIAGIPKQKIIFGIQPCESHGTKPTPLTIITALGQHINQLNYGGLFLWGIGADDMCHQSADDYIRAMKNGLGVLN